MRCMKSIMMKSLFSILILATLIGCVVPHKKQCIVIASPYCMMPIYTCIEKGDFDKTEEEREYRLFGSEEECEDFIREIFRFEEKGKGI